MSKSIGMNALKSDNPKDQIRFMVTKLRSIIASSGSSSPDNSTSNQNAPPYSKVVWSYKIPEQNGRSPVPTLLLKISSNQKTLNYLLNLNNINNFHASMDDDNKHLSLMPDPNQFPSKFILSELIHKLGSTDCSSNLSQILNLDSKPQQIIVEFGSPNIAKPLHMGHLRSTVTGHFIARICRTAGHSVKTICFLGDWGTQFGLLQAGLATKLKSVEEAISTFDLRSLLDYYIFATSEAKTNTSFAALARKNSMDLENRDEAALRVWSVIREKTIQHLETFWDQFGIKYDLIQGESDFAVKSEITESVMQHLKSKNILETDEDGCIYGIVSKNNEKIKVPLVKSDGSSLYLLRDISAANWRAQNLKFDKMFYVVDKSQSSHFVSLFDLLSHFGFQHFPNSTVSSQVNHISFGRVEGMSTRTGNVVLLTDVIEEGTRLMEEERLKSPNTRRIENDKLISRTLAISALIVYSLKSRRDKNFKFDWTEALKPVGDTGTRLQYTHARLKSLEEKQGFSAETLSVVSEAVDMDYILSDLLALDLVLHLINFEDALWNSYIELEPCILLHYLFKLCEKTSKALKELRVQNESDSRKAQTRLIIFALSRKILGIGMNIVGIQALDSI